MAIQDEEEDQVVDCLVFGEAMILSRSDSVAGVILQERHKFVVASFGQGRENRCDVEKLAQVPGARPEGGGIYHGSLL